MKTFIDMKSAGDILTKDITAHKPKMEHPVVEILSFDATDVVIASPNNYEINDPENLG